MTMADQILRAAALHRRLLLLLVAALPFSGNAFACSCLASDDPFADAPLSDAVFIGTVIDSRIIRRGDSRVMARIKSWLRMRVDHRSDEAVFTINVEEPLKGVGAATVDVVTATDSAACGFGFQRNRRYVVFAQVQQEKLWVSLCSSTAPEDQFSDADLARLRAILDR